MLKNYSLLKRKEGMSLADFRHWALEEHPKLATQMPGLRHPRREVRRCCINNLITRTLKRTLQGLFFGSCPLFQIRL